MFHGDRDDPFKGWCKRVDAFGDCWEWLGPKWSSGYGRFFVSGRRISAHRWGYEYLVGPVPVGLQLDHLCRNQGCVNPDHLEPVTPQENTRRGAGRYREGRDWHGRFLPKSVDQI